MRTVALVVAAGRGVRAGGGLPKQYRALGGEPVLRRALRSFLRHPGIDAVGCVIAAADRALYAAATAGLPLLPPATGRATRQGSVRAGLEALPAGVERVLIHDAARPLVAAELISRVLAALDGAEGALPVLPVPDTLVRDDGTAVPRDGLNRAQTPQGFRLPAILAAHRAAPPDSATDDAGLARAAGLALVHVAGDERAMKLTTPADFGTAEALLAAGMVSRTGTGLDVHRFGPGDRVMLGGLAIPHSAGVVAHSDGDVALHALTDALLGAAGLGDIGQHFPPSDERWRGASSDRFLAHACQLVRDAGGLVDHLDVTIICERPKVGPHREAIRARIAQVAQLPAAAVSVKATTTEGLGFTGRGEGIAAQAAATVRMPWDAGDA